MFPEYQEESLQKDSFVSPHRKIHVSAVVGETYQQLYWIFVCCDPAIIWSICCYVINADFTGLVYETKDVQT